MQSQKAQKIDLSSDYPCPCRRRGRLVPITLTEAFGCNRCQQIFVVEDNGYGIEQLSTTYPYKKTWRWTGQQWNIAHPNFRESYMPLLLALLVLFVVIFLLMVTRSPASSGQLSLLFFVMALAVMVSVLVLCLAFAYRR